MGGGVLGRGEHLGVDIHSKAVEQYLTVVWFVNFNQYIIMDLALSGVKGLQQDALYTPYRHNDPSG